MFNLSSILISTSKGGTLLIDYSGKDCKINESREYCYDISVHFNVQECEEYKVNQKPGQHKNIQ